MVATATRLRAPIDRSRRCRARTLRSRSGNVGPFAEASLDHHLSFHIAESYIAAGDHTRGLVLLEDAMNKGFHPYDFVREFNPPLDPVRTHPGFAPHPARRASRLGHIRHTSRANQEAGAIWSPDGTAIAFIDTPLGLPSGVSIIRRDPKGTWGTPVQRIDRGWWPSWSPDGKWLALAAERSGGSLLVVSTDSGAPRTVIDASVTGNLSAEQTEWSANGRTIYFKSHDERSNASFWSIPASGGTPTLLVRVDDPARPSYRPDWALRNNRLYFTIEQRESDIWVIEITKR